MLRYLLHAQRSRWVFEGGWRLVGEAGGGRLNIAQPRIEAKLLSWRNLACNANDHSRPTMLRSTLLSLFFLASAANALHFYLDANEKRCFIEEIPTDTVVEGQLPFTADFRCGEGMLIGFCVIGHYTALEWSEARQEYVEEPNLGIHVEVEVSTPPPQPHHTLLRIPKLTIP